MLIAWVLWMLFVKPHPEGATQPPAMPVMKYIGVAARSKNIWLAGLALAFFMGANMAFIGFLRNALTQVRGIDPTQAGLMTSVVTFGVILGNIIGPAISDAVGRIKPFLAPVAFVGAAIMYASWLSQGISLWVVLVVVGICMGVSVPLLMAFPMLLPEIGPVYAGSAGGLLATLELLGAVIIPSFIITPLAGDDYSMLFALASLSFLLLGAASLLLPELGNKARVAYTNR